MYVYLPFVALFLMYLEYLLRLKENYGLINILK
jgi:hypothetical protein